MALRICAADRRPGSRIVAMIEQDGLDVGVAVEDADQLRSAIAAISDDSDNMVRWDICLQRYV